MQLMKETQRKPFISKLVPLLIGSLMAVLSPKLTMAADTIMTFTGSSEILKLSQDDLETAQPSFDSTTNEPVVMFTFSKEGGAKFGKFTSRHVGQMIDVRVCGEIITSPTIREPIFGGSGQLSGNMNSEDTAELAAKLNDWTCN